MKLKGARKEVLRTLQELADNGSCTISIDSLADMTDYSATAIKESIQYLAEHKMLSVTKTLGDRRNCYVIA
jgi:hypothetical protein